MNEPKNFNSLDLPTQVKIFKYLPGSSLHRCRQVCSLWNTLIKEGLWSNDVVRSHFKERIKKNFLPPLNYGIHMKEIDVSLYGTSPMIGAAGKDNFVLGFENHQDLLVVDLLKKEEWLITTNLPLSKMRVYTNPQLIVYLNDSTSHFGEKFDTTAYVVSTETRNQLFTEPVNKLISLNVEYEEYGETPQSLILIITENYLQVISFPQNQPIRSQKLDIHIGNLFLSCFMYPDITVGEFDNNEDNAHSMRVWRIQPNHDEILEEHSIANFEEFITKDEDYIMVHAAFFMRNSYIVSCSCQQSDKLRPITRVITKEGVILRDIIPPDTHINFQETLFFPVTSKLFLEQMNYDGEESMLLMLEMEDIFNKNVYEVRQIPLGDLRHNSDGFGFLYYLISDRSISSLKVTESKVKVKELNFWSTD